MGPFKTSLVSNGCQFSCRADFKLHLHSSTPVEEMAQLHVWIIVVVNVWYFISKVFRRFKKEILRFKNSRIDNFDGKAHLKITRQK